MNDGNSWVNLTGSDGSWSLATTYIVHSLTANTTYTFRVRARNVIGWSLVWSNEYSFTTASRPQ